MVAAALSATLVAAGETVSAVTGSNVIVTCMDAALDGSAMGIAVTITWFGDGTVDGAVYVAAAPEPEVEMAPHVVPEQPPPEMLQLIVDNGFDPRTGLSSAPNVAVDDTVTEEGPSIVKVNRLVTEMVTVAVFEGSAPLVAVSRTVGDEGNTDGAV
jgi:hypothetical protein